MKIQTPCFTHIPMRKSILQLSNNIPILIRPVGSISWNGTQVLSITTQHLGVKYILKAQQYTMYKSVPR